MTSWSLPVTISVQGTEYAIRSDYRVVLDAIKALSAPELSGMEKVEATLIILIPDWRRLPDAVEAFRQAMVFINCGQQPEAGPPKPQLIDWDKDAGLIAPAIDAVLGKSCRRLPYLHWWEFMGAYTNINGKCLFAQVVGIRYKVLKGKPLEKWEREFAENNPEVVHIEKPLTPEEKEFLHSLGVE